MRALVRTKRQARQRLTVAFNATEDVLKAAPANPKLLPPASVRHVALSRSHLRQALAELDHVAPPNNK